MWVLFHLGYFSTLWRYLFGLNCLDLLQSGREGEDTNGDGAVDGDWRWVDDGRSADGDI